MIYYNEWDGFAAARLRERMREGVIPTGVVDERPIQRVKPEDLRQFRQCHFFAGVGGWPLALRLAGWPDHGTVWTGSCPCQPFSSAGKRRGFDDERHLWPQFRRLIAQCRPVTIFGEQVSPAAKRIRPEDPGSWLDQVQDDLEELGYAVGPVVFPAASVGAPHRRDRLYFVADSDRERRDQQEWSGAAGEGVVGGFWSSAERISCPDGKTRLVKPGVRLLADGIPNYLGIIRGAGNAIVPQQAAAFIRAFIEMKVAGSKDRVWMLESGVSKKNVLLSERP